MGGGKGNGERGTGGKGTECRVPSTEYRVQLHYFGLSAGDFPQAQDWVAVVLGTYWLPFPVPRSPFPALLAPPNPAR
jgi:hypothetical protein